MTGIIGDRPSHYAKTPLLWNAVYRELHWDAISQPWDLEDVQLGPFIEASRACEDLLGFSVTVPFKTAVLPLLDGLDPLARDIGAVNTVVRQPDGRLIGYNTDGQGAIDALTAELPGLPGRFLETLRGLTVVLVGAGGAARAVAFFVANQVGDGGRLWITNRDIGKARELAASVRRSHGIGESGEEADLLDWLMQADLVINATSKGQAGWRRAEDGSAFMLEPYSALAPARPGRLSTDQPLDDQATNDWFIASREDIDRNTCLGRQAVVALRRGVPCFDLIYAPLETLFLADARLAGHPILNGKWMNIAQAADAFATKVCATELRSHGVEPSAGYERAFEIMARVW